MQQLTSDVSFSADHNSVKKYYIITQFNVSLLTSAAIHYYSEICGYPCQQLYLSTVGSLVWSVAGVGGRVYSPWVDSSDPPLQLLLFVQIW